MNNDIESISAYEYLKQFNIEELLENTIIYNILEDNFKRNFTSDYRRKIELLKEKYISLYNYSGMFGNDLNNVNWERLMDIIYNNIDKKYDLGIIHSEPEYFIDILENKNLK